MIAAVTFRLTPGRASLDITGEALCLSNFFYDVTGSPTTCLKNTTSPASTSARIVSPRLK